MRFPIAFLAVVSLTCAAQSPRPQIIGVSNISVYASDAAKAEQFYVHQIGLKKAADPENPNGVRYYVNQEQFVEVLPLPADAGVDRLDHLGYLTANAEALRRYLGAKGVTVPDKVEHGRDGSAWFYVKDPEDNKVEFVQPATKLLSMKDTAALYHVSDADPIGRRMIHVGMLVHDREKEDGFYREILGFRPYWHGGMHDDRTDWVSQQVPDGHDWLEYMLYHPADGSPSSGSGVPQNMSQQQLGVLNHFSLGVGNMEQAVTKLFSEDRLGTDPPRPQIGRDGKWQFNAYDPDRTRVELMEYSAAAKPCCSEFTAENPTPTGQP
jgi:catechol 2,3-dioxygenase-like lactoylglutathione lyase family enzyme